MDATDLKYNFDMHRIALYDSKRLDSRPYTSRASKVTAIFDLERVQLV